MFIYTTKEFEEWLDGNNQLCNLYENIRLEYGKHDRVRESVPPLFENRRYGNRYLKARTGDYRVVAELRDIDGEQILILYSVFYKPSEAYQDFIDKIKDDEYPFEIERDVLSNWLIEQKATPKKPDLPYEFTGWLEKSGWDFFDETWIYEGTAWTITTKSDVFKKRWETFYDILDQIARFVESGEDTSKDGKAGVLDLERPDGILLATKDERYILFNTHKLIIPFSEENRIFRQTVFLLAIFDKYPNDEEIDKILSDHYSFYKSCDEENPVSYDEVARCAARSYPYYIIADKDLWNEIENEVEGINLALSTEEEQILGRLSKPEFSGDTLPVFINGRAGSGKSTILFYLFAHYCERAFNGGTNYGGTPLFLTYSDELVDVARNRVKRLLKSRLGEEYPVDPFMKPFQQFLLELLPADGDERERFKPEKRISFHKFKEFYAARLRSTEARKYSPDFCWYVIRTFVKGYRLEEDNLHYEKFDEVERREKNLIDKETYRTIYEKVWYPYNNYLRDFGYWDDQDLVRAALKTAMKCKREKIPFPAEEYTAIFCDEAQDFTRLELQFIMQLTVFNRYDLANISITSLPFAFAGDPLQTLNPTGFRWESTQATFHREIIQALDLEQRSEIQIKLLDDLIHNYRSTELIVKVTNSILLSRRVLFGHATQPQECWNPKGKGRFEPRYFLLANEKRAENQVSSKEDCISLAELLSQREKLEDTIFILPCDEGGEIPFIQSDLVLQKIFPEVVSSNHIPKNIFSPVNAKGLEFNRVILYKFGEQCPDGVWQVNEKTDSSERVEYEYYFNKLYVAATRSTTRLYAIDSVEGFQKLWYYFSEKEQLDKFIDRIPRNDATRLRWVDAIYTMSPGTADKIEEMWEDNPLAIAEELMRKGILLRKADLLRKACGYYESIEKPEKAAICEAYALKFEEKFCEAGILFHKYHEPEQATTCFWEGECWEQIREVSRQVGEIPSGVANFMESSPDDRDALVDFAKRIGRWINDKALENPSRQWWSITKEFSKRLLAFESSTLKPDDWSWFGNQLESFHSKKLGNLLVDAGYCYYKANDYSAAISVWERSGSDKSIEYYRAKARTTGYPDKLDWLSKANEHDQVIQEWQQKGGYDQTDRRALSFAANAFSKQKRTWEVILVDVLLDSDDEEIEAKLEKAYLNKVEEEKQVQNLIINELVRKNKWEYVKDRMTSRFADQRQWDILLTFAGHALAYLPSATKRDGLRYQVIKKLAKSGLEYRTITKNQVERIGEVLRHIIQKSVPDWAGDVEINELGYVVELLGPEEAVRFYGKFVEGRFDPGIISYARKRWFEMMGQLANADERRGRKEKAESTRMERDDRKRKWDEEDLAVTARVRVDGLPRSSKLETNSMGNQQFSIGNIRVTAAKEAKRVDLIHFKNLETVQISAETGEISSLNFRIEKQGQFPPSVEFQIREWNLSGSINKDKDGLRVELKFEKLTRPIEITF